MWIGAEVGVQRGRTAQYLLANNPDLFLVCIDPWGPLPEGPGTEVYNKYDHSAHFRDFCKRVEPYKGRLVVLRMVSEEAAPYIMDNSLDFVFIDADHSYEMVKQDILIWTKKLRAGGMLSGHDFHFPSVAKAVNELCPSRNLPGHDHVWWCKKEDMKYG
jgi:hypothetical protein